MEFEPDNRIVQLCAKGMELEASKKLDEAEATFMQAWREATNDFEKFTSAHYVARHQKTTQDKLKWDVTALRFALKIKDTNMQVSYPSLYLNIGKCYEDLKEIDKARENYQMALSYADKLPDNGYGQTIKSGIINGIQRISGF